ncbi:hypothetical protein GWI33_011949 [Rhynchophorus ferrugineus]|uniref:Uncharacterized protein n=1 Tax=Rhynchophorus ferrugineus TaxID=354439 RepID=A0A834IWA6_RHYFE|nr:hypothetical protein GWI33_011949 [Rhynchophorus ferrugineus]
MRKLCTILADINILNVALQKASKFARPKPDVLHLAIPRLPPFRSTPSRPRATSGSSTEARGVMNNGTVERTAPALLQKETTKACPPARLRDRNWRSPTEYKKEIRNRSADDKN